MTFLERCEEVLRNEGYCPEFIADKLLRFKVRGMNCFLPDNFGDTDFLKIDLGLSAGSAVSRDRLLEIANKINSDRKVVKMSIDDDNDVLLSAEILLDQSPEPKDVLPRLIDMLSEAALLVIQEVKKSL